MPSWRKVITSGSDASLNSLYAPHITGSLFGTASYATQALSASWAPGGGASFPYTGSAEITGSLEVTGSFSVQDSIDSSNKWLIGLGAMPGTTSTAVDWNSRVLYDTTGTTTSIDWQTRTLANSTGINNVDWENRYLYGPGPIPTSTEIAVDWNARQLSNSNGNIILDWGDSSPQFSGTASFATSASWAPGGGASFPYTGSAEITGSLGVTGSFSVLDSIDGTNKILIGSGPIPGSTEDSVNWDSRTLFDSNGNFSVRWGALRTLFDSSTVNSVNWQNRILIDASDVTTVDWKNARLYDASTSASVNWGGRILTDSTETASLDWNSRRGYDTAGSIVTLDWGSLALNDTSGAPSVDWRNRYLVDNSSVTRIEWDSVALQSQINHYAYSTNKIDLSAESEALTDYSAYGNTFTPAGEIINNVTFDVGVSDYDLVSLTSTGTWQQTSMTTQDAFKMLGIAFNVGSINSVLLEGHMVVSSGSNGAPKISNLTIGKPVYMNTTSSGVFMSNTAPVVTSQTVRLLGHVYYNSINDATWYTMKFRPSHDWVTL